MGDILNKISTYNIFNYLLPGVLFTVVLDNFTEYSIGQNNIIVDMFVYYFVGVIISRFGSLIIDPILKQLPLSNFSSYSDFIPASKSDQKIEILLEVCNMYRTFIAGLLLLLVLKVYEYISTQHFLFLKTYELYILLALLLMLFIFSYIKQINYIGKRVAENK